MMKKFNNCLNLGKDLNIRSENQKTKITTKKFKSILLNKFKSRNQRNLDNNWNKIITKLFFLFKILTKIKLIWLVLVNRISKFFLITKKRRFTTYFCNMKILLPLMLRDNLLPRSYQPSKIFLKPPPRVDLKIVAKSE